MRLLVGLGLGLALTASAHAATLRGVVTDEDSREPLAGVTVVVSSGDVMQTAITEDDGGFSVDVPEGNYLVTYYYGDATVERRDVRVGEADVAELQQRMPTTFSDDGGCLLEPWGPTLYTGAPADHTDRDPDDVPLLRVLDHHALAGLDARLAPRHAVTTIDGALRLPGAPAIATELLEWLATASTAADLASPGATGGSLDATLARGSNQQTGGAALLLGPRARFVARHGGPIKRDHAWWSTGVVLERVSGEDGASGRHGGQLLGTLDTQANAGESELGMAWLATFAPDGGADLWVDTHARLRSDDQTRELRIGLTAESLKTAAGSAPSARTTAAAGPTDVGRLAGRLMLTQRRRWHGHHTVAVGGEVGMGHADDVEHGDLRAFIGDEWLPRPNWTITGGVRWDRRELGPARVDAVLPRLSVAWDPSEEGARMWFVSAERVGALDQDRFGGWRTATAVGVDQASLGYTRDWLDDDVRVTLAARARRAIGVEAAPIERGAEVAVRWLPERRFAGELTASSLTRRLVAQASYAVTHDTTTTVAAVAEVGAHEHHWGTSLAWAVPEAVGPGIDLRLALELFDLDDADARGGRLAMSAAW